MGYRVVVSEIDVLCVARAYLDLTFTGLRALPRLGREEFAQGVIRSPGGGALNAIGAARLGLRTAGALALGQDEAGSFLRARLAAEGILLVGEPQGRTAVTVVLPARADRALVTFDPEVPIDPGPVAALSPERVIYTLDQLDAVPPSATAYVTIGDREAARYAGRPLPPLPAGATVLLNAAEAAALSGGSDVRDAAQALNDWADVVVITRGSGGAIAADRDGLADAPGIEVEAVDTTGAGDLFAAAWVWGDAQGLDLAARLRWSVLYAALSVRVPTAAAGAVTLATLLDEGARRGLTPPNCEPVVGIH
jgi:sugar/nucleoside kinase (ribokinase family)